ncbi:MAG TPA: hypothetical protein DCE55_02800, partial [Planctomycetaceae bacterium]|nr:hypothetical protein [Planctomycetaceae bacterium]
PAAGAGPWAWPCAAWPCSSVFRVSGAQEGDKIARLNAVCELGERSCRGDAFQVGGALEMQTGH